MFYGRRMGYGMCHGHGGGYERVVARPAVPSGYRYLGPCRCGYGPHAYYETPEGRVVSPYEMFHPKYNAPQTKEDLEMEKRYIEDEIKYFQERLNEIEERLKEKKEEE
jgi:hypothetical protein